MYNFHILGANILAQIYDISDQEYCIKNLIFYLIIIAQIFQNNVAITVQPLV